MTAPSPLPRPEVSATLAAFVSKRKRRQQRASCTPFTLAAAGRTKGGLYSPPPCRDFDFFEFRESNSASCKIAANFWPFFF